MDKKCVTASGLHAEIDRRIRERARGPYLRYVDSELPLPVMLDVRDASGCNWTILSGPGQPLAAQPFLELIISQMIREYELMPG
jgi:hypothetical protein